MRKNLSSHHTDEYWHTILDVNQRLIEAAITAKWDTIEVLADQRDQLIRHYFSRPITKNNALSRHDEITQLLAIDEQVLKLAYQQQSKVLPMLAKIVRGKKAVGLYQQL